MKTLTKKNTHLIFLTFIFFLFSQIAWGQVLSDDFEDGYLSGWGNTSDWANSTTSSITGSRSLKHNLSGVEAESYINYDISSLDVTTNNTTWRFNLKNGNWDPSTGNRFWFYLFANESNLGNTSVDGYVVGVNLTGSSDDVTIWKVTNGTADGAVITSTLDWSNNNTYGIEVTRSNTGLWELKTDNNGGFDNLVSAGTATNTDYTTVSYCGLFFDFTSTRAGLLWFDDVDITATPASSNDNDSQVSASASLTEPATISSLTNSSTGLQVFDFTFTDAGSGDGLATIIDQLQITQGSNNGVADWTDAISGAVLNGPDQTNMAGTINATNITFAANDMISITDGGNETYTLSVWLNTDLSAVTDNDVLEFAMNYTNITEDAAGSSFGSGAPESGDTNVAIDIAATELRFSANKPPATAGLSNNFAVEVSASDANGNTDTDATNSVTLTKATGTGTLTSVTGLTQSLSSGIYEWTDAQFDAVGIHTITATTTGLSDNNVTSGDIDIVDACATELIISEYIEGSSNNKYIEIYNNTGSDIDLSAYELRLYANGATSPTNTETLSGTLTSGSAKVYAHTLAVIYVGSVTTTAVCNFNGNDAITLYDGSSNIDILGTIGSSAIWGENTTLVRNDDITSPNSTYTSGEWTSYSEDDVSHLGSHTMTCICEEPITHAESMIFSSITENSMTISWTKGDGANRIVVAKQGSAPDWIPVDANTYTANASFGSGTEFGTGNYVVYNGSNNTVDITNLVGGTVYYFIVYEYNCSPGSEDYLVDENALTDSETTLLSNVQNLNASCVTETSVTLDWDAPAGSYEGILVTVRQGDVPHQPTCADGSTYTSANTDFSSAPTYCATSSVYVYNGTGNTVTVTNLTNASSYTFKVFTYKGSDWSTGTQTTKTADLIDVSNANATVGNTELDISWTNPANCYDEIMVVTDNSGSVTTSPSGNGSAYTANAAYGSGTLFEAGAYVVYKGTGTNFTITNLSNGTEYCSKIFVRKGTEWSDGVEVCETPLDITIIKPGDLMIMAVNTNNTLISAEEFTFVCFKDIKVGTPIDFTDNGWERVYDNKWGTTEGTIRLTRTAGGDLSAGTTVTVVMNGVNGQDDADFDIFVGGTDDLAAGNWSISQLNQTDGTGFNLNSADDIWMMQNGSWLENTTGGAGDSKHDDDYTGNILYGWTATGWGVGTDVDLSELYPYSDCFQTDISGESNSDKVKYDGDMTSATQLEWIVRVNDTGNWTTYSSDVLYDASTTNLYRQSGLTIPITAEGYTNGVWTGTQNTDWFDCGNWQSLTVPDETVDVVIGASATANAVVDDASAEASKYDGVAKCRDLTISNQTLFIEGDVNDTLMVYGNLTLNSGGILDMDDASKAIDGHLYLFGNWNNQAGEANFKQGEGTIHLVGSGTQSITTNSFTEIFNNVVVNNSFANGITLNNDIKTDGKLTHIDGDIDLNGNDIELRGVYERTTGTFIGNVNSNFSLNNSGSIADLNFINDVNLNNFTINRANENVNILSDLDVNNNLTISSGSITLAAGHNYDVGGTLTNSVGTNGLILKSDASGTASLIHATANIPATVERYLSANNWHYIFAPLSNQDISIFTTTSTGEDNPNFYWYNESVADFWDGLTLYNPTGWTAPAHTGKMLTDRGYAHRYIGNYVYSQTGGNLEVANKSFTLSYTNSGTGNEPTTGTDWDNFEGWNLFGNPYVSAVDWNNTGINKDSIENFIYYYDDSQDKYLCYGGNPPWNNSGVSINGGTQYIPAGQGFFIKAHSTANDNPFTIPESARVHNGQVFYKANSDIENLIRLEIKENDYTDETIIRTFTETSGVSDEHDGNFDAYKMFVRDSSKPQLYSLNNDYSFYYAVNTIPEIKNNKIIPLGVSVGESGTYKINMIENYFENTHIWLEDRSLEINTNLLDVSSYTFNQSAEINNERFYLHLGINTKPFVNVEIPDQETNVNELYSFDLPENAFVDNDFEDIVSISASLASGDALPTWLTFDTDLLQFSGTPSEIQTLDIKLTANDIFNSEVSDNFVLNVKNTTSVNELNSQSIFVYPNPTEGIFTVIIENNHDAQITIKDVTGRDLQQIRTNQTNSRIDLSTSSKGIYFIEIKTEKGIYCKKLVLK